MRRVHSFIHSLAAFIHDDIYLCRRLFAEQRRKISSDAKLAEVRDKIR